MGSDISKQKPPFQNQGSVSAAPRLPSLFWRTPADWSTVATFPLGMWKQHNAENWGFDHFEEWRNCHYKVHKRPWSKFTVTLRTHGGHEEKVCSFASVVCETGRPEKISGWFKDLSVIAVHQRVLVVQVVLSKAVKLLAIDWHEGDLLGTYSFAFNKEPCIQECFISLDGTIMLCRQDFWLRRRLHHVASFDANIRVIEIKDGLCQRLFIIEDNLAFNTFGSGISFDPRYNNRRVTLFASSVQRVSRNDSELQELQIFDLKEQNIIRSEGGLGLHHVIHHIKHSPDGAIIAALLVNFSVFVSPVNLLLHAIHLYGSDSLRLLHVFVLQNEPCRSHLVATFPSFSRDSMLMAQFAGDRSFEVQVFKLPWSASSLQEACRRVIVQVTQSRHINHLPLPPRLLAFLRYSREL